MSIKKILCPTDFSKAANNAVEYASKLASKTGAQITLTHVMSLPEIYDNFSTPGLLINLDIKRNEVEEKLKNYANQVSTEFHVPCLYEIGLVNVESTGKEIADESE
ncbi:MAG TPA: universal stress protein, partial [Bacteroidia bacterium]|nr:universal stress protein [Bacteroidia bacterium]